MTVRRLDDSGDIITSGNQFISEREEIAQTIITRLRLFSGEYFRDVNDGTPWFQVILTKQATLTQRDSEIRRRILQTEGVEQIIEYEADYDIPRRTYSIVTSVLTTFGVTQIELTEGGFNG